MFCLATKYQNASQNIYKGSFARRRNMLRIINMAKIPVILSKNMAGAGPCGGGSPPAAAKGSGGGGSKNQLHFKPYVKPDYMPHDLKNMRLKRPMSPHLLIYAPTLPAMTSIAQRITGTIATFYAILLSGGALFLSNGVDSYVSAIQSLDLSRFSVLIIKLILGAPFAFHYLNGIRFVAFNMKKWLMKKEVYSTAHKVILGAVIISVVFALI